MRFLSQTSILFSILRFTSDTCTPWGSIGVVCTLSAFVTQMYRPRRGLGNNSSRMCRSLSAIGASIVTRLASRTLTGNCLHLNAHQHLGYSVRVTWRMKYHSAADRCFARCFSTNDECDAFCDELKKSPIDGLCDCMGHMEYTLRAVDRKHRCHLYCLPTVETMDKTKVEAARVGD